MTRISVGAAMAVILFAAHASAAEATLDKPKLIAALKSEMRKDCFTTQANAAPAVKAKCECLADTFVNSLTPGEIAVPKQSAAINAKLAAARHACHFGDF